MGKFFLIPICSLAYTLAVRHALVQAQGDPLEGPRASSIMAANEPQKSGEGAANGTNIACDILRRAFNSSQLVSESQNASYLEAIQNNW